MYTSGLIKIWWSVCHSSGTPQINGEDAVRKKASVSGDNMWIGDCWVKQ